MSKRIKNKSWNKNSIKININGHIFDFQTEVNMANFQVKLIEQIKKLNGKEFDYAIAYPSDGEPVLCAHKKYSVERFEETFPELYEEVA